MPRKLDRQEESIRKALEIAGIDWDNVLVIANHYDHTHNHTAFSAMARGNSFAIKAHVEEWLDNVSGCGCGRCDRDDDDADEDFADDEPVADDADDDTIGNR